MSEPSYTTSFTVDRTPEEVVAAVADVRSWWMTQIEGRADAVGDEFGYEVAGVHRTRLRVEELVPGEAVVWRVVDNWFGFVSDQREWRDTAIRFEISPVDGGGSEVRFTHVGLTPADECYDVCSPAWDRYAGDSLRRRITTGMGTPGSNDEATRSRAPEHAG
ncbi:SRPBCC domain-containing protein [Blastococcus sp. SYSU DS0619]